MSQKNITSRHFSRTEILLLSSVLLVVSSLCLIIFHILDIRIGLNKWLQQHLALNQVILTF
ncbi:hypothetical protein P0136_03035 [Lentisphaerota bacterium ZTH]|nr:hypothetical protein JYG24_05825 [Lentisphaerota bacterium]WET06977.1 hypothetical protein P0136_03035 [Lentisphaerota bacterium ZTH]